ncbi:MAG: type II toxin-antitoxin system RelE/ParE family toxin [Selenomonadaceae bacterium]|nr:type II toxin-antitoxin system RelE/ParE family toxin [Selenomonadaceae bacterium]
MKITYANRKVEKYFTDFSKLKKKLPMDWVRTIKKHLDRLEAAETFGDFLLLNLGHPEQLSGYKKPRYSLHITPNVRFILELDAKKETVKLCTELEVEGVSDYHGGKENWYIR